MPSSSTRLSGQPTGARLRDGWEREATPLRIYLAGPICIEFGDRVLAESALPGPQGRHLFALVAAHHARPVSRDELAAELWPEHPPAAWKSSLKALISKLRAALAKAEMPSAELIRNAFGTYQFHLPRDGWIDLDAAASGIHAAEAALAAGELDRAAGEAFVTRLVSARPFLPDIDGPWVQAERGRLRELRIRAIECAAEVQLRTGGLTEAVRGAEMVLSLDDLRETAWRILMRAHDAAGNRSKALEAYERCRRILNQRLGAMPSPRTRAVHRELLG